MKLFYQNFNRYTGTRYQLKGKLLHAYLIFFLATFLCVGESAEAGERGENISRGRAHLQYRGVNLSGAELNSSLRDAQINKDYVYPLSTEINYYAQKNFNIIRLPFSGARLQLYENGPLDIAELSRIKTVVANAAAKGMTTILDVHDYGKRFNRSTMETKVIGARDGMPAVAFADFWSRIANEFLHEPTVFFGIMNEPHLQSPAEWRGAAEAAIYAIRATGSLHKILISGTAWSGAETWVKSGNAEAWKDFRDPAENFAFDVHNYLDQHGSGRDPTCHRDRGTKSLSAITEWAKARNFKLFLSEFGWAVNKQCMEEGTALLRFLLEHNGTWIGATYWAGGPWWPENYMFRLTPMDLNVPIDRPQMKILLENM